MNSLYNIIILRTHDKRKIKILYIPVSDEKREIYKPVQDSQIY